MGDVVISDGVRIDGRVQGDVRHMDKVDPHDDPLGHLVHDAQEVLVGVTSGAIGGAKVASYVYKKSKKTNKDKHIALAAGLISSVAIGYVGYKLAKKAKGQ